MLKSLGFTLIELLIGAVLVALIFIILQPAYALFLQEWELSQSVQALENAWQSARLVALQTGQATVLCGGGQGDLCSGDWSAGWSIQQSGKNNHFFDNPYKAVMIQFKNNLPTQKAITFSETGATHGQQGQFQCCVRGTCRALIFIETGRLRRVVV